MKKLEGTCGTTIGLKNENGTIIAVNLLGNMDLLYILDQWLGEKKSLQNELNKIKHYLANHQQTICYKSHIGKDIFFENNLLEKKNPC